MRQRKLNTRAALQIVREDDLHEADDDLPRVLSGLDSGVEKAEQNEHHLQAALSASQAAVIGGKVAQMYIPTPDAVQSSLQYDKLYPLTYAQPATYVRFSSTVEDCAGCAYDMNEDDHTFFKSMNKKKNASTQCSEDQFEEIMNCFEETAQAKQPYAAVDSPPVLSYDEIESSMDDYLDDHARPFTREIYEHWKARRLGAGNKYLIIGLKFETGADTDDADPYVCFRRREVRQIRKTRGRDAHSAEKLKKLRKELEESREIMAMIRQREITKREQLAVERQLFEQRANLRQVKLNLPDQYKEGDEDILINQRPKKKPLEIAQRAPGNQYRLPQRSDGRSTDADLVLLSDLLAEQERLLTLDIDTKIAQHQQWNVGYMDMTKDPLTPPLESDTGSTFRTATTEYLPTPPASISSEHSGDVTLDLSALNMGKADSVAVRYASPSYDGPCHSQPSFRRRHGRGGRLWIDRRGMRLPPKAGFDSPDADRFKYDDDEDEDEVPVYFVDPFDTESMQFRARLFPTPSSQAQMQARRAQMEVFSHGASHSSTSARPSRQAGPD
ncbi:MAG: Enhancer of polycomb-like protein 1 [Alectoria sarmentosa]|nr:MAG: Enhancer of polycomb-like protein 1 [Alectoria sarmentosa]